METWISGGGNRGENSAYQPTMEEPDWLLYGDLNQDGRSEIVETYGENGIQQPRRGFEAPSPEASTLAPSDSSSLISTNLHRVVLRPCFPGKPSPRHSCYELLTATSGVWINQGNYQFNYQPLPVLAQASIDYGCGCGRFEPDKPH